MFKEKIGRNQKVLIKLSRRELMELMEALDYALGFEEDILNDCDPEDDADYIGRRLLSWSRLFRKVSKEVNGSRPLSDSTKILLKGLGLKFGRV
jgi:hypothetical protein